MLAGIIFILIMILVTVSVAAFVLAPRLGGGKVVFAAEADRPLPFGYRMGWLAIRTRDTERVVERLGLQEPTSANWNNGLGMVHSEADAERSVFVTPPVSGWTFVVGLALPQPLGKAFIDKSMPLLLNLGNHFIEVQYFLAYPALDCFAWARIVDGKLVRAYAVTDGDVVWNRGRTTKEEKTLGTRLYEMRGVSKRVGDAKGDLILYPTEQHVVQLAGKWSIDPTRLTSVDADPGRGLLGKPPPDWCAERLRRTA